MILTLTLTPDKEMRLQEQARRVGLFLLSEQAVSREVGKKGQQKNFPKPEQNST